MKIKYLLIGILLALFAWFPIALILMALGLANPIISNIFFWGMVIGFPYLIKKRYEKRMTTKDSK